MIVLEKENQEWYSPKELYEMMVDLSKRLEGTNTELAKTQVLIRDYNGLREEVGECRRENQEIKAEMQAMKSESHGKEQAEKFAWDKLGYIIGLAGVVVAIIALVVK
jgi:cell division protein FtsB